MSGLPKRDVDRLTGDIHKALRCNCDSGDGDRMIAEELLAPGGAMAAIRAEAKAEALAPIRAVHARYFDLDGKPGMDDTTPEPEDVWRYDRDFRAALLDGGDQS